jgi:hypothetical protein
MAYPQNAVSAAGHSTWYSYILSVDGVEIGSFSKFGVTSTRVVERIRQIFAGTGAKVIDMTWAGTDTKITLEYVQLFNADIFEAMGYTVHCLEDMKFAFQILELMQNPATGTGVSTAKHTMTYEMCVASEWGKNLDMSGTTVVETMGIEVGYVSGVIS